MDRKSSISAAVHYSFSSSMTFEEDKNTIACDQRLSTSRFLTAGPTWGRLSTFHSISVGYILVIKL